MKYNLIFVSLFNINIKKLFLLVSKKTELYYLNIEELIEYSLLDKSKMIDVCGIDYMEKEENKIVSSINQYENTIVSMDFETFSRNLKSIDRNKNRIVYLRTSKRQLEEEYIHLKKVVDNQKSMYTKKSVMLSNLGRSLIVFKERDELIKKNCDLLIKYDISNIKETANLIVEKIKKGD